MAEETKTSRTGGGVFPLKIRGPRDFFGGLALIALALFALWAARDLSGVSGYSFGPGTVPRLFASLLILIGAAVAISGLLNDGPPLESYALRGRSTSSPPSSPSPCSFAAPASVASAFRSLVW